MGHLKLILNIVGVALILETSTSFAADQDSNKKKAWFVEDGTNEWTVSGTSGAIYSGSGVSGLMIQTGYMTRVNSKWLWGADLGIGSASYDGGTVSSIKLFGMAHYLLTDQEYTDGYFALGGVGIGSGSSRVASVDDSSEVAFRFGAGKRSELFPKLYLRPEIYIEKIGNLDPMLVIEFLKLSFVW